MKGFISLSVFSSFMKIEQRFEAISILVLLWLGVMPFFWLMIGNLQIALPWYLYVFGGLIASTIIVYYLYLKKSN